jgi:KaiC/GvpD/RAD55 family RecA-like ATPase
MMGVDEIDIIKTLDENQTILLLVSSIGYNDMIIDVAKKLSSKNKICYVTLNKTHDSLVENFKKKKVKISNIMFVDAISKTIKKVPSDDKTCIYTSSPESLTELSLAISKCLKEKPEYLIFDSLTNLLIYKDKEPCAKFVSAIINKIKAGNTKAVLYALGNKQEDFLIQETGMFVDNVVSIK